MFLSLLSFFSFLLYLNLKIWYRNSQFRSRHNLKWLTNVPHFSWSIVSINSKNFHPPESNMECCFTRNHSMCSKQQNKCCVLNAGFNIPFEMRAHFDQFGAMKPKRNERIDQSIQQIRHQVRNKLSISLTIRWCDRNKCARKCVLREYQLNVNLSLRCDWCNEWPAEE